MKSHTILKYLHTMENELWEVRAQRTAFIGRQVIALMGHFQTIKSHLLCFIFIGKRKQWNLTQNGA